MVYFQVKSTYNDFFILHHGVYVPIRIMVYFLYTVVCLKTGLHLPVFLKIFNLIEKAIHGVDLSLKKFVSLNLLNSTKVIRYGLGRDSTKSALITIVLNFSIATLGDLDQTSTNSN